MTMDAWLCYVAEIMKPPSTRANAAACAEALHKEGIVVIKDIAYLEHVPDDALGGMFGDEERAEAVRMLAFSASFLANGKDTDCTPLPEIIKEQPVAPPSKRCKTMEAVEMHALSSTACGSADRAPPVGSTSLEQDVQRMDLALLAAEKFFYTKCMGSARWHELYGGGRRPTQEELDVLRDLCRDGSKSHKAVSQRVRGATRFLAEVAERNWSPWELTSLQQAAWIRRQLVRGKSCPAHAATILRWLSSLCTFRLHPLRTAFRIKVGASALVGERSKKALCPTLEITKGLAWQITGADTPMLRAFAGLAVLAIENSCGFREANRVRALKLTDDAITGESRAKSHFEWLPWAACRRGITGRDWAAEWLEELARSGLPGPDFAVNAPSTDGRRWMPRIAEHQDGNRMLRLLLTMPPIGLQPSKAARYCFHGLKRLYPTMGIQLKSVGTLVDERGVERLGHWSKNSNMPETYNDELCVAELHTRTVVADAVQSGWRPAPFGCVPQTPARGAFGPHAPLSPLQRRPRDSPPMAVLGGSKEKVHLVEAGRKKTICKRWRCGAPEKPTNGAKFMEIVDVDPGAVWCKLCSKPLKT